MIQPDAQLLHTLLHQLPLAVGLVNLQTSDFLFFNEAARKEFGCSLPEKLEVLFTEKFRFTPEENLELVTQLKKGVQVEKSLPLEKGGTVSWIQLSMALLPGYPEYALLQLTDLSASVKSEEVLLKEIQKFEALFNYASMGIVLVNREGRIALSNPFANKQFGYLPGEILGQPIEILIPQRFKKAHVGHRDRYNERPEARVMGTGLELFAVRKNGDEFPVQISLGHFENEEGKFTLAFIVDDTDRKANEAAIIRQREEMARVNAKMKQLNELLEFKVAERTQLLQDALRDLEESRDNLTHALEKEKQLNDMKSRFVSMASHEFRTPLSTILSSITLLSKYTTSEDQGKREKHIDRIKSSVTTLTDILNEFLSLGRIEDGKVEPKWTEFSLTELVHAVSRQMDPLRKSGQAIRHEHSGKDHIVLDPGLLKNIFINLISNAIKFSPEKGVITISSSIMNEDIVIRIKDQGLGISKEDQQHLFERFFRGANVVNIQGTGLGLHIVSRYVQLMNGSISCKSELEQGTEFIIRFKQHKFNYDN
jgi:PAS domain S-box-containing protein